VYFYISIFTRLVFDPCDVEVGFVSLGELLVGVGFEALGFCALVVVPRVVAVYEVK
jgi:hypothetical protein